MLGNTVLRDYELGKQIASAGPGLLWKVHAGVKKSNRQVMDYFTSLLHQRRRAHIVLTSICVLNCIAGGGHLRVQ